MRQLVVACRDAAEVLGAAEAASTRQRSRYRHSSSRMSLAAALACDDGSDAVLPQVRAQSRRGRSPCRRSGGGGA
jgi:hypothetical protein